MRSNRNTGTSLRNAATALALAGALVGAQPGSGFAEIVVVPQAVNHMCAKNVSGDHNFGLNGPWIEVDAFVKITPYECSLESEVWMEENTNYSIRTAGWGWQARVLARRASGQRFRQVWAPSGGGVWGWQDIGDEMLLDPIALNYTDTNDLAEVHTVSGTSIQDVVVMGRTPGDDTTDGYCPATAVSDLSYVDVTSNTVFLNQW